MGWIGDLLLESVAPPPIWAPARRAKLAMADRLLRGSRGSRGLRSTLLRDIARPYEFVGS